MLAYIKRITPPFYLWIASLYPPIYIYTVNADQMDASEVVLPFVCIMLVVIVLCAIFTVILQSRERSGIFSLCTLVFFFTYSPLHRFVKGLGFIHDKNLRHSVLLSVILVIMICTAFLLRRMPVGLVWPKRFLNNISICLLGVLLVSFASRQFLFKDTISFAAAPEFSGQNPDQVENLPDIYYIVLDGFGRVDVLHNIFGFNGDPFVAGLNQLGFYVAKESHSNYAQTLLSLSSTLNLNYIQNLLISLDDARSSRDLLKKLLRGNLVMSILKRYKYRTISFLSGYSGTENIPVDVRLGPAISLSEYQNLLLRLSPIPAILRLLPSKRTRNFQYEWHRNRVLYSFQNLAELSAYRRAKFVFAHIISPHPPFVFDEKGEFPQRAREFMFVDGSHYSGTRSEYLSGYREQVNYVSKILLETLTRIIESNPDAIIILQGDHGSGSHLDWENIQRTDLVERMSILNAYRIPKELKLKLYPDITPVNTFRLLFDELFNTKFGTLKDASYFSYWSTPYRFIEVTDKLRNSSKTVEAFPLPLP